MPKYFSVDWLAQSHRSGSPAEPRPPTSRPHIPCMVQPRQPPYGRGYLQPKARAARSAEPAEPAEPADSGVCAALRTASCASPGKCTSC